MSIQVNRYNSKKADQILTEAKKVFHPNARAELERNLHHVRKWLKRRLYFLLSESGKVRKADISVVLNPWNEQGLGLQSVTINTKDAKTGEDILLKDEWKSPTVGVITTGLVEGDFELGEVEFEIETGKCERLHSLSGNDMPIRRVGRGSDETWERTPDKFPAGEMFTARGSEVALRLVLETTQPVRKKIHYTLNNGVYACEFVLEDKRIN